MTDVKPNKNLGQHWLQDEGVLTRIVACAKIEGDTVLEIGPGLGFLTNILLEKAEKVVAVEFDSELAEKLSESKRLPSVRESRLSSQGDSLSPRRNCGRPQEEISTRLTVINADFLQFDLSTLPAGYKVVANIPYYITNKIVMKLLTAENKPSVAVLLVQKEVAERLAAKPGDMSILSVAAQTYAKVELGEIVPARMFTPPPKVDSQVVVLTPLQAPSLQDVLQGRCLQNDLQNNLQNEKEFFRVVKAGFSQRRKKLRTALAGGLNLSVGEAEKLLHTAGIDSNLRAQDLSLDDWRKLAKYSKISA